MPTINMPNNWRPRAYQLPAWNYLANGGTHAEIIWHRRAGKDDLSLNHTGCAIFERVANYWHMLPEYAQARKAIWDAVNAHTGKKRIEEAFPDEIIKSKNNQEMKIEFKNRSTWQVVGSDRYNSLVGAGVAGLVYSEWPLANPNARAYLAPMVRENNGWQLFIGTPRGRNHAYRTLKAAEKNPRQFAQILTARQTNVFTEADLQDELENLIATYGEEYGRSKFEQEYLCSFDAANIGAILARAIGVQEQQGLINDAVDYDPMGAPIEISMDIGRRDTTTAWFWQPKVGGYSVFDHNSGWGLDAEEWAVRLRDQIRAYTTNKYGLGKIWLPHDARAKTFAAKRSAVEIFIDVFGASKIAITPNSKISDRVNAARILMPHIEFNARRCEKGLEALRAWSYEYDEEKKMFGLEPVHDWASHDGDGFSYGCLIMRMSQPERSQHQEIRGITVGNNTVIMDELWRTQHKHREGY